MSSLVTMTRRGFIKTAGIAAGYSVLSINLTRRAFASALNFVGLRQQSVYKTDAEVYKIRKSQDNPMVQKIYNHETGFLHEGPCGHMSHHLLHTHYEDRSARVNALKAKGYKLAL
ncbi:iron hydrogenase small subunit [Desulfovibrio ferrophilus]|uniref:Iron hydrogenase small subunit n=1 Tax=Desulfovibrio ferrophilus TaxID=241368 RepID=A0A2Z6AXJ9_9BACT|nr:iron hydrogenase small subunit [Desulfovibrio ferrophilus]BBD07940.1 iron hydrogenase small subunit [Desulfovibrio ferrophilus]